MRKQTLALFLAVLVAAAAMTAWAVCLGNDQQQVAYQENVLYGDLSVAKGLTVSARYGYQQRAYWFTDHVFSAQPKAYTDFRYYTTQPNLDAYQGLYMGVSMHIVGDLAYESLDELYRQKCQNGDTDFTGLMDAYRQLVLNTEEGTMTNTYLRIADYCQYYPLRGWIDTPVGGNHWNPYSSGGYLHDGKATADAFNSYFRIPVLEDHWVQAIVDKRTGSVMESVNVTDYFKGEDTFRMDAVSTTFENTVYFTFSAQTEQGNTVDTSLIPGGYGLYAFTYAEGGRINTDSLTTLCPLDITHRPEELWVDEATRTLQLYTEKDNDRYLTVFDLQTMEMLQQLQILEYEDSWHFYKRGSDFLLAITPEKYIDIWQQNSDGTYAYCFRAAMQPKAELEYTNLYEAVYAFDGQRLAIADRLYKDLETQGYRNSALKCGYSLMVYTEDGLVCCAEFAASLESPATTEPGSNDKPYTEKLEVTWGKTSQ